MVNIGEWGSGHTSVEGGGGGATFLYFPLPPKGQEARLS